MLLNLVAVSLLTVGAYAAYECGTPAFPIVENSYGKRIVGGWEAKPHSFPWQVYVKTFVSSNQFGACGGSLIQPTPGNGTDLVVSAAHCVHEDDTGYAQPSSVKVVVGAHQLLATNEPEQKQIPIKNYAHASYKSSTKEDDIIVIKLKEVVFYTQYTRPVCLPQEGEALPAGSTCLVSGWGTMSEGGSSTKLLRQVDVKLYTDAECYLRPEMRSKMFCAGHPQGGKDSCQGDSGGPFVCNKNGKWTQYGVVSFGAGCAKAGKPGVYVNLPQYVKWVKEEAKNLEKAKDFSGSDNSVSNYRPASSAGGSSVGQEKPIQAHDSYYLSPTSNVNSILKPNTIGSKYPFPQNNMFESTEVASLYRPGGAVKPGVSHSFSGLGSNFGSSFPRPGVTTTTTYTYSSNGGKPITTSSTNYGGSTFSRPVTGFSRF